jgi:DNA-binding CsgD family transcriptional regulator
MSADDKGSGRGKKPPYVSQAPPPISPLAGRAWVPSAPKPPVVPSVFPSNYPAVLRVKTELVLSKTLKQFPNRSDLKVICRAVLLAMTPVLCTASRDAIVTSDAARDHMRDLLRSVCEANCTNQALVHATVDEARSWDEWDAMLVELEKCAAPNKGEAQTTDSKHDAAEGRLPGKQGRDLSSWLNNAEPPLTPRQLECMSMKMERLMTISAIARHLDLNPSTVRECISEAEKKINRSASNRKRAAARGILDPEKLNE